ncbi:hypothetical protein [Neisseria meningitidis]|nr:hypothetical protein [Neisseria meningitidis]
MPKTLDAVGMVGTVGLAEEMGLVAEAHPTPTVFDFLFLREWRDFGLLFL